MKGAALHTSEMPQSELQSLLDAAVDAIVIIDRRGVMTRFNPSAERIFGYKATEVLGRNVSLLMPEPFRSAHDGYLARYAETGVPHIIGIGREIEARRKDGSTFPASLAVSQVSGKDPAQYVGFVRDITTQREALSTIRHERDRANGYLELFPHVLMTCDHDGTISAVNERGCALLERTEYDLLGRSFIETAVAPEHRARVAATFDALRGDALRVARRSSPAKFPAAEVAPSPGDVSRSTKACCAPEKTSPTPCNASRMNASCRCVSRMWPVSRPWVSSPRALLTR